MTHTLFTEWKTGFNTFDNSFPFSRLKTEEFEPALIATFNQAKQNIESITTQTAPPTFANTIEALEFALEDMEVVSTVYHNLYSSHATPELQALAQTFAAHGTELSSFTLLNDKLFERVRWIYDHQKTLDLNAEQAQLLKKTFLEFSRNGALLSAEKKEDLKKIDLELATLAPKFSENLLHATNEYFLEVTQESDLKGLPENAIESARELAQKKDRPQSWIFTLQAPSFLPFMTYCTNRILRQELWQAFKSRCVSGKYNNQPIILQMIQLRETRAQLLGYAHHADFVLSNRMAKSTQTVFNFLNQLYAPSLNAAKKDIEELYPLAKSEGIDQLMPWDVSYLSEKLKQQKYAFNQEDLRPYFALDRVITGVFEHAKKLFNISFKERNDIDKYHPEVRVYEVTDLQTQDYVGLFYADFFPRETKRGGAWMSSLREQGVWDGKVRRPHVTIVCNFTKPTQSKPSLLTYDEVRTLFHEFGHALHGLLSKCHYRSLAGTNVLWDFVELPSQIMENWAAEKEGLDLFAKHFETGAAIPSELLTKMKKADLFQAGYNSLRQIRFANLDMKWHTTPAQQITNVVEFETQTCQSHDLLPTVSGMADSPSFGHIFAGGYSAGYYSYKWAEVLDADAFEYFKQKGIFNAELGQKFKSEILEKGSSQDPEILYKNFRGQDPDPMSLLKRDGLI